MIIETDLSVVKSTLSNHGYEYVSPLNRGGFSTVHLVRSTKYQMKEFAAKIIERNSISTIEIKALLCLGHPNIISFYDHFEDSKYNYLILAYCQEGSLQNFIASQCKIGPTPSPVNKIPNNNKQYNINIKNYFSANNVSYANDDNSDDLCNNTNPSPKINIGDINNNINNVVNGVDNIKNNNSYNYIYNNISMKSENDLSNEYCDGVKGLKEIDLYRFSLQILEAVDFCHKNGVAHRDIKPANILIDNNGRIKLTDFGISVISTPINNNNNNKNNNNRSSNEFDTLKDRNHFYSDNESPNLNRKGIKNASSAKDFCSFQQNHLSNELSFQGDDFFNLYNDNRNSNKNPNPNPKNNLNDNMKSNPNESVHFFGGSKPYMAPEVIKKKIGYDIFKADIWSLGITFYQMITGTLPWTPCADEGKMEAEIMIGMVTMPTQTQGTFSRDLIEILRKMLSMSPSQRPTAEWILHQPLFQQQGGGSKNQGICKKTGSISSFPKFGGGIKSQKSSTLPQTLILTKGQLKDGNLSQIKRMSNQIWKMKPTFQEDVDEILDEK